MTNKVTVNAWGVTLETIVKSYKSKTRVTSNDKDKVRELLQRITKRVSDGYFDVNKTEKIVSTIYKRGKGKRWICVSFFLKSHAYITFGVSDIPVGWRLFSISGYTDYRLEVSVAIDL